VPAAPPVLVFVIPDATWCSAPGLPARRPTRDRSRVLPGPDDVYTARGYAFPAVAGDGTSASVPLLAATR